jgi:hypothetical protein
MTKPKWVNPTRQAELVRLFVEGGNNCLLGHKNCPIPEHYLHVKYKLSTIAKAVNARCFDSNGNTLTDGNGNELYITVYESEKVIEQNQSLVTQYELLSDNAIKYWQADDRQQTQLEWKAERKAIHSLNESSLPLRGRFSNISSVIWHESQPIYYLESIGMNGLTLKPFALVKMASSYQRLYVDLGDSLRSISKNRKRKAIRYHKPLPSQADEIISTKVGEAVKHYLNY